MNKPARKVKKGAKAAATDPVKSEAKSETPPIALVAPDGAPMVVPAHGRGAIKQGGDHDRPGRPRNATRAVFRELLEKELAPNAVKVIAKSKKVDDHLRAIDAFAAVGFNEKIRIKRLESQAAAAAAGAQAGASAAVQVHVSGGPTGVERPSGEVQPG